MHHISTEAEQQGISGLTVLSVTLSLVRGCFSSAKLNQYTTAIALQHMHALPSNHKHTHTEAASEIAQSATMSNQELFKKTESAV